MSKVYKCIRDKCTRRYPLRIPKSTLPPSQYRGYVLSTPFCARVVGFNNASFAGGCVTYIHNPLPLLCPVNVFANPRTRQACSTNLRLIITLLRFERGTFYASYVRSNDGRKRVVRQWWNSLPVSLFILNTRTLKKIVTNQRKKNATTRNLA